MHTRYFLLSLGTQGSIGYNPSPIHSCIHTLIPAASWQDVASIHPPQWHSNRITQSPANLTWSVASDCVWGFLLFFMLCTCTLRRHHCVDDGHRKKAGDVILWQGSCTLASLLSETFSPVRLFWCTGHFFFFFFLKCKRNIFKALRD